MLVRGPLLHLRARRPARLRRWCAGGPAWRGRWGRLLGPAADGQREQRRCRDCRGPTRCRTFHCLAPPLSKTVEISRKGVEQAKCHGKLVLATAREMRASSARALRGWEAI